MRHHVAEGKPMRSRWHLLACALYLHAALAPIYVLGGIGFVAWRVITGYGHLGATGDMGAGALIPADYAAIMIDRVTYGVGLPWLLLALIIIPLLSVLAWRRQWFPWWWSGIGWSVFVSGCLLLRLDPWGIISWYGS